MAELRKLNYIQSNEKSILIDPSTIPNLIPDKTLKEWQKDDPDPFYKVQEIEYPIVANRINYKESFFESFISKLKNRPTPGSRSGHSMSWGERPPTDFIMVGGKLEKNGDGTGKVYFKNYIPPSASSGSNDTFIRENKSDMVHYSLVSVTKDEIDEDDEGNWVINVIGSIRGERNDAVEYDGGAMQQKTNETMIMKDRGNVGLWYGKDPDNILKVTSGGHVGIGTGHDPAFPLIITNEHNISEQGNKNNKGEVMTKDEILEKLKTLKTNAEITLNDVAKVFGLSKQIITEEHIDALKVVNSLREAGYENPVEDLIRMKEQIKLNSEAVRNAELDKAFGIDDGKNYLRQYAGGQAGDLMDTELAEKINSLKEDPIAKKLAKEQADYTSDTNTIGSVETKNVKTDTVEKRNGVKIDKY